MSSAEKSVPQVDFSVRGPLPGMGAAVERILRALPAWFGIEAALQAYVAAAEEFDTFVLLERATKYAGAEGYSLLHVKTLAPSDPDPGYAATRAFYEAVGFLPLEVLPQVWGPENPCLLLVRPLWAANV
jgi:hypothetical protein